MFGKYHLVSKIADGGMADVFLSSVTGAEGFTKQVVLKRLAPHLAQDAEFIRAFVDEAKVASGLTHPRIVQVHELGVVSRRYFLAMEYVPGCNLATLRDLLWQAGEPFPPGAAMAIAVDVLDALAYAHDKQDADGQPLHIVHGGVVPENILLSFEGLVKVTDFGIAKARLRTTRTDTAQSGSKLGYAAPEQTLGKPIDRRADLFSFSVVLYELLSGKRLFGDGSDPQAAERARRADVPPLTKVSPVLAEVIALALHRDPERRPASATELSRLLVASGGPRYSSKDLAALVARQAVHFGGPARAQPKASVVTTRLTRPITRSVGRWPVLAAVFGMLLAAWFFFAPKPEPTEVETPAIAAVAPPALPVPAPPRIDEAFGYLTVNSMPRSYVYVDGEKLKATPVERLRLGVGTHSIKCVDPVSHQEQTFVAQIEEGHTVTRVIYFDR